MNNKSQKQFRDFLLKFYYITILCIYYSITVKKGKKERINPC